MAKLPPRPKVPPDMDDTIASVAEWLLDQPGQVLAEEQVDYGSQFGFHGLFGTSDSIILEPDRITTADLKYGFGIVEVEWNPQLMIYLSGAVAKYGRRDRYRLAVLQPRGRHDDGPIREWEFGNKELDDFNKLLSTAIHKNYKGGKPVVGDYCRKYCKAMGICPAAAKAAVAIFKENPID